MKRQLSYMSIVLLEWVLPAGIQAEPSAINYFDSPPPSDRPVVFAKGVVSIENRWEEKICFTADGKEAFFGIHPDPNNYFLR